MHAQSLGHELQSSPVTHSPSPHTGLQLPVWHDRPVPQVGPHEPPQPLEPQVAPLQVGVQQALLKQAWPERHGQSAAHD